MSDETIRILSTSQCVSVFLVPEAGVGALFQVVIVRGGHGHDHHARRAVLGDVAIVHALGEQRGVVVDVLQVHLSEDKNQ